MRDETPQFVLGPMAGALGLVSTPLVPGVLGQGRGPQAEVGGGPQLGPHPGELCLCSFRWEFLGWRGSLPFPCTPPEQAVPGDSHTKFACGMGWEGAFCAGLVLTGAALV